MTISLHPARPFLAGFATALAGLFCGNANASVPNAADSAPYDSVNLFIGTTAGGNTFPGATLPFGMMQWGPDTRGDGWYHYEDHSIRGFSLTHISGAGCPIFGDVPILPWIGEVTGRGSPREWSLAFSHDREQAHPGFYAVTFDNGIAAEITAAARAGIGPAAPDLEDCPL